MTFMRRRGIIHKMIALVLVLGFLFAPGVALADSSGKHFKRGKKHEVSEQWDLAAEEYALALNKEPGNAQYKLHLLRSLTNASLMFMDRGKALAEQKDYEGAYQAYRQAYSYDNTNELALTRMREMLVKQGIPLEQSELPEGEIKKASERADQVRSLTPLKRKFRTHTFNLGKDTTLDVLIRSLAERENINVIFDSSIARQMETTKMPFVVRDITIPRALDVIFTTNRLSFVPVDKRTIVVFQDALANRQRFDELVVRTFYLKSAPMEEARTAIQIAFSGKQVQVAPLKQLNALLIRDTPDNLKMIEALLNSIDKSQAEVVLDVNLYEVNDETSFRIGNQLGTDTNNDKRVPTLSNLGGIGQSALRANSPAGVFGPIGLALAAPTSVISLLQSKSASKLIASTQIRAFENEAAQVNIGQRVPVRTATIPTGSTFIPGNNNNNQTNPNQQNPNQQGTVINQSSTFGVEQIQYVDVGLNIDVTPTVSDDYVQMKMTIESTGVVSSNVSLNPTFTQRRMKGVARIKEGETGVVASVMRVGNSNSRSGFPILGFIPIVGRFFSTPDQKSDSTNVVITITPHVLRSPEFSEYDRLALGPNGTITGPGVNVSLEEMIIRADQDELQPQTASNNGQGKNNNAAQRNGGTAQNGTPGPVRQPVANPGGNRVIQPVGNQFTPSTPVNQEPSPSPSGAVTNPNNQTSLPPEPPPNVIGSAPNERRPNNFQQQQPQQQQPISPVTVTVRVLNPQIKVGQGGLIGVILNSSGVNITNANMTLRFNSSVIKITSVRDGGLLSLLGAQAEFNSTDVGDSVTVNINRPPGSQPVQASGQLVLIYFQGVGEGSADLNIGEMELRGPNGAIPVNIVNGNIEVQGNPQQQPPPNEDDDDDE
jgi:general secretion pathway protein D